MTRGAAFPTLIGYCKHCRAPVESLGLFTVTSNCYCGRKETRVGKFAFRVTDAMLAEREKGK